jgi:uncharacterized membrane protein
MGKHVVLAVFPNEAAAQSAVERLREWDKLEENVRLNAIGILTLDENGNVAEAKVGRHVAGKGAGIGASLGLLSVAITPVVGLGVLGWTAGGAVVGRMVHKGLGLKEADLNKLHDDIFGGKAAVGVLIADYQAPSVVAELQRLGGVPEAFSISNDVTDQDLADARDVVDAHAPGVSDSVSEAARRGA